MNILGNISAATKKIMNANALHAQKSVDAYLAGFDDATLRSYGVKRSELKTGGSVNFFL